MRFRTIRGHLTPMLVISVIQNGVVLIDSETPGLVFLETLRRFRDVSHNQPLFGKGPFWIERNNPIPCYVIHNEGGMKARDAFDDMLSEDGSDFDFPL